MPTPSDDETRDQIAKLLSRGAISPLSPAQALAQESFNSIVRRMQGLSPNDLVGKLRVSGLTLLPYVLKDDEDSIERACSSCINYERHRRFCNLPELMLPVELQWSCIVWRM